MGRTAKGATSAGLVVVRPILPGERERFDETLLAQHWLGAGLVSG